MSLIMEIGSVCKMNIFFLKRNPSDGKLRKKQIKNKNENFQTRFPFKLSSNFV